MIVIYLCTGQIYVYLQGSEAYLANMTLPATPTSVIIGGLVAGTSYAIRAAAWTSGGLGPASSATSFIIEALSFQRSGGADVVDPLQPRRNGDIYGPFDDASNGITSDVTQVVQEKWFILVIGGVVLTTLVLVIAALVIRRRWVRKKAMSSVSKVEPPGDDHSTLNGQVRGRDIIWSRGWHSAASGAVKEAEMEAQTTLLPQYADAAIARCGMPPPEYAELLNHHNQV